MKLREHVTLENLIEKLIERRKNIEQLTEENERLKLRIKELEPKP